MQTLFHIRQTYPTLLLVGSFCLRVATGKVQMVIDNLHLDMYKRLVLVADAMFESILDEAN